jgi:hypothetical protein
MRGRTVLAGLVFAALFPGVARTSPAHAVAPAGEHHVTGAFPTPDGGGFWLAYADGRVSTAGGAPHAGDASRLPLNGPVVGGSSTRDGRGYWLVGSDGGIFSYGRARFFGSMGGRRLNQPVFSMTPTRSGRGYWLVARDGGVFSFGDARFYGSAGSLRLNAPIVGITTSPSGRGYRMVAADGGIFSYGDVPFYGSLPGRGIDVRDVVGMAPTPTNKGYWIARRNGKVYGFGDAVNFGAFAPSACDPVTGVIANPSAPGYRLVMASGHTVPFGDAPGGSRVTGRPRACPGAAPVAPATPARQRMCRAALATTADYQALLDTRGPVWSGADGAFPVDLGDGRRLWLFGDTFSGPTDATRILDGYAFVRNSVAVEEGTCFDFRLGGSKQSPMDFLPRPVGGQWFWPLDGVVDHDTGLVHLTALRLQRADGPVGFRWRVIDHALVTLDAGSLQFRSWAPMPRWAFLHWGLSLVEHDGWVYVYARADIAGVRHYVARTRANGLLGAAWEFFDGSSWSADQSTIQPMEFQRSDGTPDDAPLPALSVERYGDGFLASAKRCDILCDDVTAWYAPTPNGPWHAVNANRGRVATTLAEHGLIVYGGRLVPSADGTMMVLWSVNDGGATRDKYAYGPRLTAPVGLPDAASLAAEYPAPPPPP